MKSLTVRDAPDGTKCSTAVYHGAEHSPAVASFLERRERLRQVSGSWQVEKEERSWNACELCAESAIEIARDSADMEVIDERSADSEANGTKADE